jgi:plastocyanin
MSAALWAMLLQFADLRRGGLRVRGAVVPAAVLLAALPASAGTITGRVSVLDRGGRPAKDLTNVVVYVDGVNVKPRPASARVSMKGKQFLPHVVAVPVGGTVEFPNDDPIFHNVFSVSGENRFDLPLYKRPKTGSRTFHHPGVVKVYCNIHPQMSAVVVVRDNPYFTKVSPDGSFTIENVPPGRHVVKAWHERAGESAVELAVPEQGSVSASLALDASKFKRVQHKNKFGKDYSRSDGY